MQLVAQMLLKVVKGYALKLASEKFIEWALLELADALVKSTKTPHDDKVLEKIKEIVKTSSDS